jgi:glycosyltransferase involved in cell wall biosynthesis
MTESPLVTIGLPVFNSARYLRQSLDSLLAQTYTDFVLVISDNASTDETPLICKTYAATDSRIKYSRNPTNIGNPRNFNRVFELTTTRYLKWSTGDDFWERSFLGRALEVMEHDPTVALCYPQTWLVDAEGSNPTPYEDQLHLVQDDPVDRFLALLERIRLAHQHLGLIRTSCLRQTHLLGDYIASDINLLAELTLYGKFYELPERLFFRRFHETSGSWKRDDPQHDAKYYYGGGSSRRSLARWRGHLAFFAAVGDSPLAARSNLAIYQRLVRRMIWNRRVLLTELIGSQRARSR